MPAESKTEGAIPPNNVVRAEVNFTAAWGNVGLAAQLMLATLEVHGASALLLPSGGS